MAAILIELLVPIQVIGLLAGTAFGLYAFRWNIFQFRFIYGKAQQQFSGIPFAPYVLSIIPSWMNTTVQANAGSASGVNSTSFWNPTGLTPSIFHWNLIPLALFMVAFISAWRRLHNNEIPLAKPGQITHNGSVGISSLLQTGSTCLSISMSHLVRARACSIQIQIAPAVNTSTCGFWSLLQLRIRGRFYGIPLTLKSIGMNYTCVLLRASRRTSDHAGLYISSGSKI